MTDVRDPEPRTDLKTPDGDVSLRQNLVTRALSPIRRVTGRDVAVVRSRGVEPRGEELFELEPRRKFPIIRLTLLLAVLLPTALAGLYLFAFASDQYVAETRFAVRQADDLQGSSGGGSGTGTDTGKKSGSSGGASSTASSTASSVLTGTVTLGGEDAEIVANYIHSRTIIDDVSRTIDVRAIFQRPEADFWARLPQNFSAEDLAAYWNRMVSVYVETSSGIVSVRVSAFRREDALTLTRAILRSSEALANTMSVKIRMDTMSTAEAEVRRSEGEVRFALANLTTFRNSEHLIDPTQSSASLDKLLVTLMTDKIETESQLFVAQRVQGFNAPGLSSVRDKLESINDHIAQLKDQMAGGKGKSSNLAATLAQFETLDLKRQFAETMFGFARDGLERARLSSERQQIYLAVFVPPSLPQDYSYPARWSDLILVAIGSLMVWVAGATSVASVLDHRL